MEAVVGSVPQSQPIELAKVASIFTRFAGAGSGGVPQKEKKKRLKRTSNVDDLEECTDC